MFYKYMGKQMDRGLKRGSIYYLTLEGDTSARVIVRLRGTAPGENLGLVYETYEKFRENWDIIKEK